MKYLEELFWIAAVQVLKMTFFLFCRRITLNVFVMFYDAFFGVFLRSGKAVYVAVWQIVDYDAFLMRKAFTAHTADFSHRPDQIYPQFCIFCT